jgi:hypothetical protein
VNHGDNKYLYARISARDPRAARLTFPPAVGLGRTGSAFEESTELTLEGRIWGIEKLTTGHDDDVDGGGRFMRPENFARQALRAIPDNGTADFSGGRHAETRRGAAILPDEDSHQTAADLDAGAVDRLEVGPAPDVLMAPECLG